MARARFDGMSWPVPDKDMADLGWKLRYGSPTRTDLYAAAEALSAYRQMVNDPEKKRRIVIRNLSQAAKGVT